MSPVFRHGGLRLYLLKLLDEAPRHGYEVIRLLQDRFLGVYSPSPGTIYPRLARLEEEGLVTHDEVDGKKIYRITDKGRAEIQSRLDDLAELEEEITESVRDIAREVTQDVRDTVRNLREELTWAARDVRGQSREQARDAARERVRQVRDEVRESARRTREEARSHPGRDRRGPGAADEPASPQAGPDPEDSPDEGAWAGGDQWNRRNAGRRRGRRGPWPEWAAFQDWQSWAGWQDRAGGRPGWPGFGGFHGPAGGHEHGTHGHGAQGHGARGPWVDATQEEEQQHRPDPGLLRDLERIAIEFARELRSAAWHTGAVGENSLRDLRMILTDTLDRIRDEVFGAGPAGEAPPGPAGEAPPGPAGEPPEPAAEPAPDPGPGPAKDQGPDQPAAS